jgi:hypothetical protein
MKPVPKWLGVLSLAGALAAVPAFAQDVSVDYNHNYQFNQMKSYSWGKVDISSAKVEPRVVAAIDHVIQQYGFKESSKDKKGDVIVTVVEGNSPQRYEQFYRGMSDLNWRRDWGGGGFSDSARSPRTIHGGTLWRGTAAEGADAN